MFGAVGEARDKRTLSGRRGKENGTTAHLMIQDTFEWKSAILQTSPMNNEQIRLSSSVQANVEMNYKHQGLQKSSHVNKKNMQILLQSKLATCEN